MERLKIEPKALTDNAIKLIGEDWMLITAGNADKFNTMTASWGGVGFLWNKPVVFVFVRPERYTFEFMEANDCFTLSFFEPEYKKTLSFCGTVSGREVDKITESGLTPYFTERGTPAFQEARIVMECRKLYGEMLSAESFIDSDQLSKWYGEKGNLHKMYVAEIITLEHA